MRLAVCFALLAASAAQAQDWGLRDSDRRLSPQELQEALSGRIVAFYDDGRSEYYDDGRYTYTYARGGGTAYGYWSVNQDGAVCVAFVTGAERCDLYVRDGERLVLLDQNGDRYPVRPDP
ncbi:hypothetical protein [Aestuariicoccus sp. MJ-SS9]|uniref:hypothetical protein n=1 Tax=Aestuariicoccus sp. MJ-SS9 TaxID=3079855 RepID=UPI00290C64D6|nr:hypothetical protein [Aestuariicoccus sp. MJ-SS9]MDU8910215.1 hypothetical protein [Aestuariicoccus sp. MJ-SS9]